MSHARQTCINFLGTTWSKMLGFISDQETHESQAWNVFAREARFSGQGCRERRTLKLTWPGKPAFCGQGYRESLAVAMFAKLYQSVFCRQARPKAQKACPGFARLARFLARLLMKGQLCLNYQGWGSFLESAVNLPGPLSIHFYFLFLSLFFADYTVITDMVLGQCFHRIIRF